MWRDGSGIILRKQTPWPRCHMGFPAEIATLLDGGQEGQYVTGRKPGKDLVTTKPTPVNHADAGRSAVALAWRRNHDRDHAEGENFRGVCFANRTIRN